MSFQNKIFRLVSERVLKEKDDVECGKTKGETSLGS